LAEKDIERVGERWGVKKRDSTLGHLVDPTKVLTLNRLDRSTDHDFQDRIDGPRDFQPRRGLPARCCLLPNILDNVPTTPATDASTSINFGMVENLLDLSFDLVFSPRPQRLASFDVQETEGIDSIGSAEEHRLRECLLGVILRFLERDAYKRKGIFSQLQKPRGEVASLTTWVATHWIGTTLKMSLTVYSALLSSPTGLRDCLAMGALVLS